MSDTPTPEKRATTTDHLLIIFAGVFAHPTTFDEVAGFIDDGIVGDDKTVGTLWTYLQANPSEPSLLDAAVDLVGAGITDVVPLLQQLTHEAEKLTPARIVSNARKLARSIVNTRRREAVKRDLDASPASTLDVEAVATAAAQRYPHTSASIRALTPADCEQAVIETHTVIPTGFAEIDRHARGFVVGEQHLLPARTGDGKSSVAYGFMRNQLFANAARHREGAWWDSFGSEWRGTSDCGRLRELLRPVHAGHDAVDETYRAPHLLWFSLEEPLAQVLGRFYCDLLTLDRQAWITNPTMRERARESYAKQIEHINNVLGCGRLTLVDYSTRRTTLDGTGIDTDLARQTLADIKKKTRAWTRECQRRDKAEGVERPRLCLIDYGQLVQIPETKDRFEVLDEVARGLTALAKEVNAAFFTTLMLLRGHESVEPTKEDIKGSSQFAQDAARIFTLWPCGKRERQALREHLQEGEEFSSPPAKKVPATPFENEAIEIPHDNDLPNDDVIVDMLSLHCRRAQAEIRVSCEKDRFGDASWQTPLAFDGRYARITDALPDIDGTGHVVTDRNGKPRFTSFRQREDVMTVIRSAVKTPKPKRRDG